MEDKNVITIRESDGSIINMEIHKDLPSVTRLAREYARAGYPDRYVVFSDGKKRRSGTRGRGIESIVEPGMYMACILRPSIFPSQAPLLTAMSATAMAMALEEHTTKPIGIGWVSSIYCNGVRIGDVTIEGKLDSYTTYEYLIVTFAAKTDKNNFPPRLTDMIRKVFESENTSISMIIARSVLARFFKLYPTVKTSKRFMDDYSDRFVLRGKSVKVVNGTKKTSCKVLGVDTKSGALIVEGRRGAVEQVFAPSRVTIPKRVKMIKPKKEE